MREEKEQAKGGDSCGATVNEHLGDVIKALAFAGVGFACPESYQALAEMVEFFRRAGGHQPHTATIIEGLMDATRELDEKGEERFAISKMLRYLGQHPDQLQEQSVENIFRQLDPTRLTKH